MNKNIIVFGFFQMVKGFVLGIFLTISGVLIHHKPLRKVETVSYAEFQNPHVSVLDSIYEEIGVGVYQGEIVLIREGVTSHKYLHKWVVYRLQDSRHSPQNPQMLEELLYNACTLVQKILSYQYSESCLKDSQTSQGKLSETLLQTNHNKQECLNSLLNDDMSYKYPIEDVVYQVIQRCPRIKNLLFRGIVSQEKHEINHKRI